MSNVKLKTLKIPGLNETFTIPGTMEGASSSDAGAEGNVPAPAAGDQEKFLRGDGRWAEVNVSALTIFRYIE